jgi:hypothetical protein
MKEFFSFKTWKKIAGILKEVGVENLKQFAVKLPIFYAGLQNEIATGHCKECAENLCSPCVEAHKKTRWVAAVQALHKYSTITIIFHLC